MNFKKVKKITLRLRPRKEKIKRLIKSCIENPCPVKSGASQQPYKCKDCPIVKKSINLFGVDIITI